MRARRASRLPGAKPEGTFHHGDLRAALLIVTARAVERLGEQVSLRELAEQLGVTQPAVYRHFSSKEALLTEVALEGYAGLLEATAAACVGLDDPFEVIRASTRAYVRHAQQHPGWFRLAHTRARTELLVRAALTRGDHDIRFARDPLRDALGRVLGPDSAELDDAYRAVWGLAHGLAGLVVERVFQRVETDDERIAAADSAIAIVVDALRARHRPTLTLAPANL